MNNFNVSSNLNKQQIHIHLFMIEIECLINSVDLHKLNLWFNSLCLILLNFISENFVEEKSGDKNMADDKKCKMATKLKQSK